MFKRKCFFLHYYIIPYFRKQREFNIISTSLKINIKALVLAMKKRDDYK